MRYALSNAKLSLSLNNPRAASENGNQTPLEMVQHAAADNVINAADVLLWWDGRWWRGRCWLLITGITQYTKHKQNALHFGSGSNGGGRRLWTQQIVSYKLSPATSLSLMTAATEA